MVAQEIHDPIRSAFCLFLVLAIQNRITKENENKLAKIIEVNIMNQEADNIKISSRVIFLLL